MHINAIYQKISDFLSQWIDTFQIEYKEEILLMISGLRALGEFENAIALYQKYENLLQDPDIYPVALSNILQVCKDCGNSQLLIKYAKELKAIYPDYPFVNEI